VPLNLTVQEAWSSTGSSIPFDHVSMGLRRSHRYPRLPWRIVGRFSRFLSVDGQIFIRRFDYKIANNAARQTARHRRLYVMDRRQKQKLERDLERYHALLKLVTDERAVATIKQLIRESQDHLNHINNGGQPAP
jgi:hypothetical protein